MGEPKLTGTHDTHALTLSPCARARAQGGHWYVRLRAAGQMDNQSPTKIHQGRGRHIEVWSQTRAPHQRNCFAAIKEVSRSCGRRSPHDPGKMITKRVLYTEGDWVERGEPDGTRSVFVVRARASHLSDRALCDQDARFPQMPRGCCWIEGDNPSCSNDSRSFGPVPLALIEARVAAVVWPPWRAGPVSSRPTTPAMAAQLPPTETKLPAARVDAPPGSVPVPAPAASPE